jgi:hypothetical protein
VRTLAGFGSNDCNILHQFLRRSYLGPLRFLLTALSVLVRILVLSWASLAIYYSNLPSSWLRSILALLFLGFGIWVLWRMRKGPLLLAFAGLLLGVVVWHISIQPSHDCPWRPEVAVMPRAIIDGDGVRITGVRNFQYTGRNDFKVRYEQRDVSFSHLTSVDFFISYFMIRPIAHTFLSFNFDNALPLCVSIETRPEVGEGFSPIASLFKQFELIYIVGDERDLVRVRTDHRYEDVYMYRIRTTVENARELFRVYLARINELADRPEFYHLLSNNCTVNIVRYARAIGKPWRHDIRYLVNGFADSYLYSIGAVDTSLPFRELRRRSRITDVAKAAGDAPDFSERIRASLPSPQP